MTEFCIDAAQPAVDGNGWRPVIGYKPETTLGPVHEFRRSNGACVLVPFYEKYVYPMMQFDLGSGYGYDLGFHYLAAASGYSARVAVLSSMPVYHISFKTMSSDTQFVERAMYEMGLVERRTGIKMTVPKEVRPIEPSDRCVNSQQP
eukprot:ANDGO_08465.mRNA.1 hypothetical protein